MLDGLSLGFGVAFDLGRGGRGEGHRIRGRLVVRTSVRVKVRLGTALAFMRARVCLRV